MTKRITARQKELLLLIRDFTKAQGYPPSRRDLLTALGVTSTNTIACLLNALAARKLIVLLPRTARGITLAPASLAVLGPV